MHRMVIIVLTVMLITLAITVPASAEEGAIKRTIVFSIDSINALSFKYAIDNGYCPNIKWLIDHGAYYENAVSVLPSVSISSDFSILTGAHPGKHNILGWMWYNKSEGKYYSIDGSRIYDPFEYGKVVASKNWMSNETETLFEVLEKETNGKAYTSALGTFASKGVDYSIIQSPVFELIPRIYGAIFGSKVHEGPYQSSLSTPAKGSSGDVTMYTADIGDITNFFFLCQMNRLLSEGVIDTIIFLNMIYDVWKSKDYENSLIYVWISGSDASGQLSGGKSEAMLRSYQIVDAKVRITMAFCKWWGIGDETMFVISGNHGIKGWNDRFFERIGYRGLLPLYDDVLASGLNYVSGNRGIYFPDATMEELEELSSEIIQDRFVDFVIYKNEEDRIIIRGKSGIGELTVENWGKKMGDTQYTYRVIKGNDPLNRGDELAYSPFYGLKIDELHKQEGLSAPIQYPDAIERIIGLFCSENVPDLIITIGGEAGGQHGDLGYEESVTPLVFGGPGIKKMRTEKLISITDIAPTITKAMGFREPNNCDGRALDIFGSNDEGSNDDYSLPSFFRIRWPLYIPLLTIGFSFLLQIPLIFPLCYLLHVILSRPTILLKVGNLIQIKRIITIREIRAMLPDPPEYLGTYAIEDFRTFIL